MGVALPAVQFVQAVLSLIAAEKAVEVSVPALEQAIGRVHTHVKVAVANVWNDLPGLIVLDQGIVRVLPRRMLPAGHVLDAGDHVVVEKELFRRADILEELVL